MPGCAIPPSFDADFQLKLTELIRWRRDVRRFHATPLAEADRAALYEAIAAAPSVGLSEPWRIVRVVTPQTRAAVKANFTAANDAALAGFSGARAEAYARLKLAGLDDAPEQWAVFAEMEPDKGHGLGRATMPEMAAYSVAGAIMQLWLVARARGLGVGWVSILDAAALTTLLDVPPGWRLVAYLCIGTPEANDDRPELERSGWEARSAQPFVMDR